MYCKNCGQEIAENLPYCRHCGEHTKIQKLSVTQKKEVMFPTIGEYNQTIQNKGDNAFQSLSKLSFIPSKTHPIKVFLFGSGSYAVVFKANQNGKYFAIRCFITAEQETISRYKSICDYLKTIDANWKADSQFLDNEISVNGNIYPVLKMDWVEGILLNQFISNNLNSNETLTAIQNQLLEISDSLERNKVGHGDLQCGNIIVQGTSTSFVIKLIDYDGMFVPSLTSKKSIEKGRSEFQHPSRNPYYFNYDIDRFSFWVMLTALEALKFDKSLWKEVMQNGYNTLDNLLFTTSDFRNPSQSNLFNRLLQINSTSLSFYAAKLKWFCTNELSKIEKPVLFGKQSTGSNNVSEPSNFTPNSNNSDTSNISANGKFIINSNRDANVLTSTFQKLGITPLQLDKNIHEGKTLIISYGTEFKRIIIETNQNVYEINFTA